MRHARLGIESIAFGLADASWFVLLNQPMQRMSFALLALIRAGRSETARSFSCCGIVRRSSLIFVVMPLPIVGCGSFEVVRRIYIYVASGIPPRRCDSLRDVRMDTLLVLPRSTSPAHTGWYRAAHRSYD
jgi:hypothetical protein